MRLSEECMEELGKPIFAHRGERFQKQYMELIEKIGEVLFTKGRIVPVVASGSGGIEFMLHNLIHPNDRVLCLVNGHFSERMYEQAQNYSRFVDKLEVPWRFVVPSSAVRTELEKIPRYDVVTVVSSETSTGAWTDIEAISKVCREYGCMLLVDHVSGVGNPYYMDDWGIDATVTTTHESFACLPSLAVIAFSDRAIKKAFDTPKRSMYFSLPRYLKYQDERKEPPFTVPTTLVVALNKTLDRLLCDGVEGFFKRCSEMASTFRSGVTLIGYELATPEIAYNNTCTAVYSPYDAKKFVVDLEKVGAVVAPGKGKYEDKVFRVGHSGVMTVEDVEYLIGCLLKVL
jgi:alanine-glyoxylate transaminase/serine-glyoxylate transaminase/serine-pyruvate transaminase